MRSPCGCCKHQHAVPCTRVLTALQQMMGKAVGAWLRSLSISTQLVPEPVRRVQGGWACKLSRQQGCGLAECQQRTCLPDLSFHAWHANILHTW